MLGWLLLLRFITTICNRLDSIIRLTQMSLVDRLLVSEAKSPRSIHAVCNPRWAASMAMPAPVAPPPITKISNSFFVAGPFCNLRICSAREGNPRGPSTSLGSEITLVISRPGSRFRDKKVVEDRRNHPPRLCWCCC